LIKGNDKKRARLEAVRYVLSWRPGTPEGAASRQSARASSYQRIRELPTH
jgi:hypothetical protein